MRDGDDLADHDDRRRLHRRALELVGRARRACASTVRSPGIVPSQTTATGVAPARPPRTSAAAIGGAFSTAIISTTVPRRLAERRPVDQRLGVARRQVAGDDRELVGDAAVGDRDAGDGGDGDRAGQARDDRDRDAGLAAGEHLLVAAAEDEVVAALEPHHPLAGQRALDDQPVDLLLLGRAAARQLGDVDQLDVGGQLAEQLARREPVGDDDVGLHQRLAAGDRDQLGVAGPAADQHHARHAVPLVPARRSCPRAGPPGSRRVPRRSAAGRAGRECPSPRP